MCGRYTLVKEIKLIIKKFNLEATPELELFKSYNIVPSQYAPVIASDLPNQLQLFSFGYIPSWQKTRKMLINARSEGSGKYYNLDDNPRYTGAFHIKSSREFKSMIHGERCLVLANCFFEGSKKEKLSKPYVVYLKDKKIFALAGIWKEWVDKNTGEVKKSFAILTTYPNELMHKHVKHHRTPVIIREENYPKWLDLNTPMNEITELLHPLPANEMNAYPVSTMVKDYRNNSRELIEPIGERVYEENDFLIDEKLVQTGFGDAPARRRRADEN